MFTDQPCSFSGKKWNIRRAREMIENYWYPDPVDGPASKAIFLGIGGLVYYEQENCFFVLDSTSGNVSKLNNKGTFRPRYLCC